MEATLQEIEKKMSRALEILEQDFQKVRTGRANPAILDGINVDYYGTPTPLSQVGNITVPDPQMIVITPWEKKMLADIEKEILKSDLGMTPQNDGNIIRLPIPALTEERRKEMVKQIKKMGEDAKISIRNVRRDGNDKLKKMEKAKEISQDDLKLYTTKIQEVTDKFVGESDKVMAAKETELMSV
ncbi:MAG: ribosome recycling factor [Deltaproteobacteria bacterium]|jgi:ribosome recycling factor|nr:ribosome recycling factor [Deltaproteobacteria bacterium]MBT4526927.1 ribosome recycling factor [Deltaproteobacteria bacterium]